MSNSNIILEKFANDFRQKNGMGSDDPIRLKSILNKLNVITLFKNLSDDFSGMALKITKDEQVYRFMLVNSSQSLGKQHFTICHELYHLYIQENFTSRICKTAIFDKRDKEEYNADIFASILLMPEFGIKGMIPDDELIGKDKISIKTILRIEHYFSCSRTALLYRLKELGIITSRTYDLHSVNVKQSALQHGYTTDLYIQGNANNYIGNYGEVARELFESDKISETHYITLLTDWGLTEDQIESIFNGQE